MMTNFLDHLSSPIEVGDVVFWIDRSGPRKYYYGEVVGLTKKRARIFTYPSEAYANALVARLHDFFSTFEKEHQRQGKPPRLYMPDRHWGRNFILRDPEDLTVIADPSRLPETVQKGLEILEQSGYDLKQSMTQFC